jgi:prolycopene isomerase
MITETYDVIIIGAGMGGLSAGAYLTKAGKRVLVLEHYVVPGGYAHEFTRGYFSFDVSLRALDGIAPGSLIYPVLSDLGLLNTLKFRRLNPFYTAHFPEHTISVNADYLAYEAQIIDHFPHESVGIRSLIDAMIQVYQEHRRYNLDREAQRTADSITKDYPNLYAATMMPWATFMQQHIKDPQLQAIFSIQWNYLALPPSQISAAIFILRWVSYHIFGAYYPEDGVMTLSWALARTIKDHGGQVQYRQTVKAIDIREGEAVAVETDKGQRFTAKTIISNANVPDTMLNLVGESYLPAAYVEQVQALTPSFSNIIVYMGLDRDLQAEGWLHHDFFISNNYDCETSYQAVQTGNFDQADLAITYYNVYYPTCAPKGSSVVSLYHLAPWDYANQWGTGGDLSHYQHNEQYQTVKEHLVTSMITRAEEYIPRLRDSIRYQETATPLTNLRFSCNPGGSFSGSPMTVDNTFSQRMKPTTPIPNLFLAGAWVSEFGISSVMLSGRTAARLTLAYLGETG